MQVPSYVTAAVVATSAVAPLVVVAALRPARQAVGRVARVPQAVGVALLAWLGGTAAAAAAGLYQRSSAAPTSAVPLLIGIGGSLLVLWRSALLRALIDRPATQARLVAVQLWRVLGATFLILLALGELPAVFAVPAGVGDIVAGIAAPVVAGRLQQPGGRGWAVGWNLFGLADLVMAIALGATTAPGAVRIFPTVPSSELMTAFPMALVPTFLVPLSIVLHIVSLRYLLRARATRVGALVDAGAHLDPSV